MSTISADWINPFILATTEIFKDIVGVEPKLSKPYVKQTNEPLFDISGIIGITGEAIGSIAFSLPKQTALKVVSRFIGEEVLGLSSDTRDAIGELTNIIAGRVKKIFYEKKIHIKISIPNVIVGKEHTISSAKGIPTIVIPFETELGNFAIQASLKKA
ncbi:chemotaxis protein CheX [Desulfurella multipotens]|uniref:Chemotaxis protein CheX n=1 Tax=Desulfurella multipotens TaxID=79269 RepID=A0A1G6HKJ8_9BACT|nr:chemotaxis protein CheX [Desulfurella multipotens]SDB94780.1 chemotaxis protein CheX [Desulfurella multipotens]